MAKANELIHRFWDGPTDPLHAWTGATFRYLHPRAQLIDWTYASLPPEVALLMTHGDVRHDSNVARYALLLHHGGLWVDNDVIALEPLTSSPDPWTAGAGRRREGALMWFPTPGHHLLVECLERAVANPEGPSPARSGARLLTGVGRRYPDVALERRVLSHDAVGRRLRGTPKAVHLWSTSSVRHLVHLAPS